MMDAYTRTLLTVLTLLVAIGVAHQLGSGEGPPAGPRFTVVAIRAPGGPILIRTDSATGQVWKRAIRADSGGWTLLVEEPAEGSPAAGSGGEKGAPAAQASARAPVGEEEVKKLSEVLRADEDPGVRAYAARQLGKASGDEVVGSLVRALQDPETPVVVAAIGALRKVGDRQALPALRKLSAHPDPHVREAAVAAVEALDR